MQKNFGPYILICNGDANLVSTIGLLVRDENLTCTEIRNWDAGEGPTPDNEQAIFSSFCNEMVRVS